MGEVYLASSVAHVDVYLMQVLANASTFLRGLRLVRMLFDPVRGANNGLQRFEF